MKLKYCCDGCGDDNDDLKTWREESVHCLWPASLGEFRRLKLQLFYFPNIPMVSPFILMIDFVHARQTDDDDLFQKGAMIIVMVSILI